MTGAPTAPAASPSTVPSRAASRAVVPAWRTRRAPGDLVARLERLAALHQQGALDDDEYERAKHAVLGDGGAR